MTHATSPLRSIAARLTISTALLVAAVLAAVTFTWAASERRLIRESTEHEARSIATSLAGSWENELIDNNWNQIRTMLITVMDENPDAVYVLCTDRRRGDRIIAAEPPEQIDRYVPDLVRVAVTEAANLPSTAPRTIDAVLLRDVEVHGVVRGRRGERIVEVAADIRASDGTGTVGVLRVGLSTHRIDQALADVLRDVTLVATLFLAMGALGALLVGSRLASPLRELERSAGRMAQGDLGHRAAIQRSDEIGTLARTFNVMAGELQTSFGRLEATLASFERFVPRKFLAVVAPEGIENIRVGVGARREMTILFSDIRGYTALSERTSPEEMFELLNEYLARMGAAIEANGGFIDKYIGDAIMALFDDANTDGALRAALAMRDSLDAWNVERVAAGKEPLHAGIGVHRGSVFLGTVGYRSRIDSTVIGDAVNLAARVEKLTKDYGATLLVTEDVVKSLATPDAFVLRVVDAAARVRGKGTAVALVAVEGLRPG